MEEYKEELSNRKRLEIAGEIVREKLGYYEPYIKYVIEDIDTGVLECKKREIKPEDIGKVIIPTPCVGKRITNIEIMGIFQIKCNEHGVHVCSC